jgi:hypothetical protein
VLVSGGVVGVVSVVVSPPAGVDVVGAVVVVVGAVCVGVLWIVLVLALSELEPPQPATRSASASANAPARAAGARRIVVRIRGMIGGGAERSPSIVEQAEGDLVESGLDGRDLRRVRRWATSSPRSERASSSPS